MTIAELPREKTEGQLAYEEAVVNLDQPSCTFRELLQLYPDKVFYYGDDGYGLKLTGNFIFYTHGYGRDITRTERETKISERGFMTDFGNWIGLDHFGQLPEGVREEILRFSQDTREKCQAMRPASRR